MCFLVSQKVAELIKSLNQQTGNTPASFHLIGFSLGAHVVGYAGRRLNQNKIGRITGNSSSSSSSLFTHKYKLNHTLYNI